MGLLDILNGMQNGPHGRPSPSDPGRSGGGMSPMMMALLGLLAYKAIKGGALGNILGGGQTGSTPGSVPGTGGTPAGRSPGGLGDILAGRQPGAGAQPTPPSGGSLSDQLGDPSRGSGGAGGGGLADILGGLLGGGAPGTRSANSLNDLLPGGLGGLLGGAAAGTVLSGGLGSLLRDLQNGGLGNAAQSWVGTGPNENVDPNDLANALGSDTVQALSAQTGLSPAELLEGLSRQLPEMVDKLTPDGRLPTEQEASRLV